MSYKVYKYLNKINNSIFEEFCASHYANSTQFIKQYIEIKKNYLDCLVFFRIGDFYELFFDDAILVHKELNIFLTKKTTKANAIDMCGIPHHALNNYIFRLVKLGYRIVICDQIQNKNQDQNLSENSENHELFSNFDDYDNISDDTISQNEKNKKIEESVKKIMDREVIRVITSGTITDEIILDTNIQNYLVGIYYVTVQCNNDDNFLYGTFSYRNEKLVFYISYANVNTGELNIIQCEENMLSTHLGVINPSEILISENQKSIIDRLGFYSHLITIVTSPVNKCNNKHRNVEHFFNLNQKTFNNFNIYEKYAILTILNYIDYTKVDTTLCLPKKFQNNDSFPLDYLSIQHLEILKNYNGERQNSLFSIINRTYTKQGSRLLQQFILNPLKNKVQILKRQNYIAIFKHEFQEDSDLASKLSLMLQNFGDIDRLMVKINNSNLDNKTLIQTIAAIKNSLIFYIKIQEIIASIANNYKKSKYDNILCFVDDEANKMTSHFDKKLLNNNQISQIKENKLIQNDKVNIYGKKFCNSSELNRINCTNYENQIFDNFFQSKKVNTAELSFEEILNPIPEYKEIIDFVSKLLDCADFKLKIDAHPKLSKLKHSYNNHIKELENLENKYRQLTKDNNLKIVKHNLLKYCIEVQSKSVANFSAKVFDKFISKQQTGKISRFKTAELDELEQKIIFLEVTIKDFEREVIKSIVNKFKSNFELIKESSGIIGHIDIFLSLAIMSHEYNYVRPSFSEDNFKIISGRHVVLENICKNFQANDIEIKDEIVIITGPNMGGKSTFLRQVAIIVLLAQIGSFVPATFAEIKIVDQIFTRIGSGDNPTQNQSTFMKEMIEMNYILRKSTKNSLIILDEIGRGTAHVEGLALAFAIIEYIFHKIKAICILATHYHKIYDLQQNIKKDINLKFYFTDIEIIEENIKFLYKLKSGIINKPYGILVANFAGLSKEIINNATSYLDKIE